MRSVVARMAITHVALLSLACLTGTAMANEEEVTPLEKVVTMLEDLQTEVLVEGKAEAKTYDKFACFCKDMSEEKSEMIQENTDWLAELEAEIAGQFTKREEHDLKISESSTFIAEKDKAMKAADDQRAKDYKEFKIAEDDCFVFKKELDWAVVELMSAEDSVALISMPNFLTVKSLVDKVWNGSPKEANQALTELKTHYSTMSPRQAQFFENLLQTSKDGHLGSVVKKVKELKPGMEDTLKRLRADEVQSKHLHQMVIQGLTDEKKAEQKILNQVQKEKGANTQLLAENQKDATLTQGELMDDKAYITQLTEICNTKSKMWDQRSEARAAELTALTSALTIIKQKVASKVSDKTVRLVQKHSSTSSAVKENVKELYQEEEHQALNFLQLSPRKKALALVSTHFAPGVFEDMVRKEHSDALLRRAEAEANQKQDVHLADNKLEKTLSALSEKYDKDDATWQNNEKNSGNKLSEDQEVQEQHKQEVQFENRKHVMKMLRLDAKKLHSVKLSALAAQISTTGPFDKITKLIQELIERLLQEAADEANHQGWCNKAMTEAKEQRGRKATAVAELNDVLAQNEAKRDALTTETNTLTKEIEELESALDKATKERNDESEENGVTVKEASEGKEAIEEALDMLDKFYKTAAKNKVFTQGAQIPDMPDAGFDGAYTGGQSGAKGILGMMEVIRDDFARTVKVTEKAEKTAAKDFLEFETETKSSLATKTNTNNARSAELAETKDSINTDNESMVEEQKLLDKAIQELIELQPACVPKVESYADRVAKREQEIESLKKALCTLDENGPVQTEAGDCGSLGL